MSDTASKVDALALLPLPTRLHLLTGEQLRGAECVWCCETLDTATAVGFGDKIGVIANVPDSRWFPRACPTCIGQQARKALSTHTGSCEQCVDDPGQCPESVALRELTHR